MLFVVSNNLLNYHIQDTVMNTTVRHPRMVNPGTEQTFIRQDTDLGGLEVHTTDAVIDIDTTAARESMGFGQMSDRSMLEKLDQKGKQVCADYTRSIVRKGNMVVENRTPPSQLARMDYMSKRQPEETVMAFYPAVPAEVDVNPGTTDIRHNPTQVNIDWANTDIVPYRLERGTVSFDIVQRAYVDFTYMGDPMFFPDPEFQAWA